jgi:hypothetical protein
MRVILDTNVVVDVLQRREPCFQDGSVIFLAIANKRVIGCLTAKQIADLHFFSRKQFKGEENVDDRARQVIGKLLTLFELIDTLSIDCKNALGIKNGDYEEGIFNNGEFIEGKKRITYTNGSYEGGWLYGCKNGYGVNIIDGITYKGNYENGKRHGKFTIISLNGSYDSAEYVYGEKKFSCIIF